MDFGRVLTAMATPFDDHGQIDFPKINVLVDHLIENGSDGLVVAGTTGESATLSFDEKVKVWKRTVEAADGRIPVLAGAGTNGTNESLELSLLAKNTGVDGLMLVVPYYNKPNQEGLYLHFKTIAEKIDLPIMIYNVPGRTVVRMTPETVIKLSQVPNIVAVKEATGDLSAMAEMIDGSSEDFNIYTGDDHLTYPSYAIGARGVVSVSAHVAGAMMQEMLDLFDEGKTKEAAMLHRKLVPVCKGMFIAPSPAPIKAAIKRKGLDVGGVRLPMVPLTKEEEQFVHDLVDSL
ncbi:4-hydroxy-tetrahydrodipicolinate synthase [Salimicrobium flavidum]|uniref:4-hydroxy-tetrahydrodipicolinate synthase n=1 Tax=Salimicrobium flavidum TaxID=570947 RepID=A0A1N7IKF9_9BACI|nr:4-hydroxy-tetrahydrodipicolinate synthase [Salimicrobium flavidum]SIS37476.1 4-hydroxy-tetrahydrodipicolinate synthase [Salimicrobium flavidum]